jgi:Integrase core domain
VTRSNPPALQAQIDFAEFRLPWGKRFALLAVLGYSRLLWLQFYPRQTLAVLMRGLEEAFAAFGGVPGELLFDQMKAVIIEDQREVGGKLLENTEFLRFAAPWDFRIRACRPYRARTKGKVERPVGVRVTTGVDSRSVEGGAHRGKVFMIAAGEAGGWRLIEKMDCAFWELALEDSPCRTRGLPYRSWSRPRLTRRSDCDTEIDLHGTMKI